ncbi:nitroreductase [Erysipelotrichaceae bacterium Oil+RF-744-GAM-WT-6]|uniref:Nitroreductase n=1 Tax=Stecheria intestinalis TaxID=2606630 RepID=A0A7X2NQW9_9FIRM|nr:nitroreductase [Stecheria intestinalis]
MDLKQAMETRHAVREFTDQPLAEEAVKELKQETEQVNLESGLHIQLVTDEPEAFDAGKPHYGSFSGCWNYFVLAGPSGKDEEIGYYGERLVLKAQQLGINSCWVAMTYRKGKAEGDIRTGEKRYMVIALGYGKTQGTAHKQKKLTDISDWKEGDPDWYLNGLKAALLAPTAINQQKYYLERHGDHVHAKAGLGFYTKTDLGIVKYHFEAGSGKDHSVWE